MKGSVRDFDRHKKRWLIGIDWCRTEPTALALLASMPASQVRIVDGVFVVARAGCTPRLPWHPKVLILRGPDAIGIVAGSGNLSLNGMTRGHEVGSSIVVERARNTAERQVQDECQAVGTWFDAAWKAAARLTSVADDYESRFREAAKTRPPVTDDDTLPGRTLRGVDLDRIQKMRTASKLWIQAGNLHENLGAGQPGNQLMLSPMTRVFFGAGAEDLPINTHLGYYNIRYGRTLRTDCSLRFSHNSMDVLTLPHPGSEGPASYDQQVLCFTKVVQNGEVIFDLEVGNPAQRRSWKARSRAANASYSMQGRNRREWGAIP
jgi:hypothetical protein